MTKISDLSCCSLPTSLRLLGLAAAALLTLSVTTSERAEALSPINPGAVAASKVAADAPTIEVRGVGYGGGHGGGHGGFGGYHGGGMGAHGGSFHTGPAFVGGAHVGGFRHGGHGFAHRHFRRVFVGGVWYDYPYYDDYPTDDYPAYYAAPGCRIVVTDYGPRRVCNYRPWRHHYHPRHHHRRYHRIYH